MASSQCRHVSLDQMKVMSAIERLPHGGARRHVLRCEDCAHTQIAYNSCRNRHCPKFRVRPRGMARRARGELLPVPYFHVSTPAAPIADIAYQNRP